MTIKLDPYLNFRGSTREAMAFYHQVFGGDLLVTTFKEFGGSGNPADDDLVMHADLDGGHGIRFMASDVASHMAAGFTPGTNFSMSLQGDSEAELRPLFEQLAEGGEVTMPLGPVPWGATFGMCTDRFGIAWMVNIAAPGAAAGG
jgi:PhnB protein